MDPHTCLLLIGAVFVLVIVPGPDMAYYLARTFAQGRRAGVLAVLGINVGAYVHMMAAVLGLSAILATSSTAFTVVKWIGAGYLVWLGLQAFRSGARPTAVDRPAQPALEGRVIFWQGFLCDVLNPKVALFYLTFLPQFVQVQAATPSVTQQLLILGVTCNVMALAINLLVVHMAHRVARAFRRGHRLTSWLERTAGILLVGLGLRLALERN
jgi:threonine/homoserine/homoserine lactone efflux protein